MQIIQVRDFIRYKTLTIPTPQEALSFKQKVLLNGDREKIFAEVVGLSRNLPGAKVSEDATFGKVLTGKEVEAFEKLQEGEIERIRNAQKAAEDLKLEMKFFSSRIGWDNKVSGFLFVSEKPVDFRELLKVLPKMFSGRIHLQRVDPRDRAQITGGIGPCGRLECCMFMPLSSQKVSLDAVRDQGVMIKNNPKIYDVSGKIKRCFLYEVDQYRAQRKYLPHIKQEVSVNGKKARVTGLDILNQKIKVVFTDGGIPEVFPAQDVEYPNKSNFIQKPLEFEMPAIDLAGEPIS